MDILLVTWDGGGAVPPMLGLGAELRRRGHRVRCLGPDKLRAAIERSGLEFRPLRHAPNYSNWDRLPPDAQRFRVMETRFGEGYERDVRAEVAYARPDAAVVDFGRHSAHAAVESLGIPCALLGHAMASFAVRGFSATLDQTNAARARVGLEPVASVEEMWAATDAVLMASTPLLDPAPPERIPGLRFVGPIFEPDDTSKTGSIEFDEAIPLVLIGLSTSHMDGQQVLLGRVIEAMRNLPVRAFGTAGPEVDAASLPAAGNVTLHEWLPHNQVLPHAALMITHAGHSSVVRSLSHGVPMLCIPLGRDQPFNAERVQAIGAGLALPTDATPAAIAEAVQTLLAEPSYRAAALQAASIAAMGPGAANGADVVEEIAERRGRGA